MKYQALRLDKSPYLNENFSHREKKALENEHIKFAPNVYELDSEKRYFLITNTHTDYERIPEIVLERTELLIHPNSGFDNIQKSFVDRSDVPIIVGSPIRAGAVTEFILSTILKYYSPIENHIYWKGSRKWDRALLEEKQALVIGAGNIGHRVINTLKLLCKKVDYVDPYSEFLPPTREFTDQQLKEADMIIFCAELNSKTEQILNKERIGKLKKDVLIINPSRGELIDEAALLPFLETNKQAFAYLDVFSTEPFSPGFGNHLTNLNKTSHIAGVYENLQDRIIDFEREIIHHYIQNKKSNNIDIFWEKYAHLHYQEIRKKRGY